MLATNPAAVSQGAQSWPTVCVGGGGDSLGYGWAPGWTQGAMEQELWANECVNFYLSGEPTVSTNSPKV